MNCPSHETLRAFLEGQLPDPNMSDVADHVVACAPCVQTLTALRAHDPLVEMVHSLKDNKMVEPQSQDSDKLVARLVERMCALPSQADGDDSRSTPVDGETLPDAGRPAHPAIPGYEILDFVKGGGMGEVYKARHLALGKVMALKLCTRDKVSASLLARFRQEMQAVGRLNHAQIVQAHDAGTTADGMPYLAMEYLEGNDLASLVKQNGPLPIAAACECMRQAALGLQHAHEQNMVHRDLKPANLLLTTGSTVKILDLGLARLRERTPEAPQQDRANIDSVQSASLTAVAMGTPEYMAPEQWQNAHDVDIRADLYSLGCTLYHLLAGRPPFAGDVAQQRIGHVEKTPPPIRQLRPDVPAGLADILDRLLAKDAAQRPRMPAEVAAALEPFARTPGRRSLWVRPWLLLAAAILVLGLAAAITYVVTDRGTVIVETDDPDIEVVVKQNGRIIDILDRKSGQAFTLRSGIYELELKGGKKGLKLSTDRLVLKRGDREIVRIRLELPRGWIAKGALPYPAASCMVGVTNGQIFVLGGFAGQASLPSVQAYHPVKDKWDTNRTPFPKLDEGDSGRYNGSAVVVDGKIYVVGGWRHFKDTAKKRVALPTNTLLIYDPAKDLKGGDNPDAWSQGKSLPLLSGSSLAGVIGSKIHVLSGVGASGKRFHAYDLASKQWSDDLKPPPHGHIGGAGGASDGKFYAVGGHDIKGVLTAQLDVYDAATGVWATKRPMPAARTNLGGVVLGGKLYVIGGADAAGKPLDTVEVYDPNADSWTSLPPLAIARQSVTVAAVGNTLYALGGSDGTRLFGTVEALDLATLSASRK